MFQTSHIFLSVINILDKQSRTADNGCSSNLVVERVANNSSQ